MEKPQALSGNCALVKIVLSEKKTQGGHGPKLFQRHFHNVQKKEGAAGKKLELPPCGCMPPCITEVAVS